MNMKKITHLIMVAVTVLLASCNQNEMLPIENEQPVSVTFLLTTDAPLTRSAVDNLTRYAVEVYKKDNLTTPYLTNSGASGNFFLRLPQGEYTCLFWADYGEGNYNISNMQSVSRQAEATNPMAYCLKQDITVTDGSPQTFTLKHAVAAIQLVETKGVATSPLTVSFTSYYTGYNVMAGNVVENTNTADYSATVTVEQATGETTIASFYTFAPENESIVAEFKFRLGSETEKTVSNVPLQANYRTLIKGSFCSAPTHSFSVTADADWNTPDDNMDIYGNEFPLKLGDKYKKDGVVVGPVILVDGNKALVLAGYDLVTYRDMASAQTYATEKGGRLPTKQEFSTLYTNLKNSDNTALFGGSVVTDFTKFNYMLLGTSSGQGGAYLWGYDSWYAPRTDCRVLAVMEVNW